MGSFDTKPTRAKSVTTPIDLTTSTMTIFPQSKEGMMKTCGDLITKQESRRVEHNNNHIESMNIVKDEPNTST